jgi:predicted RNase H-like HicB family nuclease
MGGYQLTAISERDGEEFIAHCVELDITGRGSSREAALANLKEAVSSFVASAKDAEILGFLTHEVEVSLFEVELTHSPVPLN